MERFLTGVDERGDGKVHLADDRVLLRELHRVRFDERVPVLGHVLVFDAFSVERVKADPRADLGIVVAEHGADIAAAAGELFDELSRGAITGACRRHVPIILLPRFRNVTDVVVRVEERFEIRDQIADGIPRLVRRFDELAIFKVCGVNDLDVVVDLVIPFEGAISASGAFRLPSSAFRHVDDGTDGDRGVPPAFERLPLPSAFARMIPVIGAAPLVPERAWEAAGLQRHADLRPFVIVAFGGIDVLQHVGDVVKCVHFSPHG